MAGSVRAPRLRLACLSQATLDDIAGEDERVSAIAAGEADDAIVNAMERLFGLLDKPAAVAVLRPLIMREIHFWLLSASHGGLPHVPFPEHIAC